MQRRRHRMAADMTEYLSDFGVVVLDPCDKPVQVHTSKR